MSGSPSMLNRLARRVLLLFGRGRVATANDGGPVQLVQVQINELETIDNLSRLAEFGFTSMLPRDSDVAIAFIGGDRSNGVIVASNHQPSRPTGLLPGETMLYSQDGKYVYMTASGGISVFANGQPVNVTGATTVTITASEEIVADTPLLKCTGDILDNCNTNTRTVAEMRTVANGHTHKVVNVQGGGSTIETNPPDQDE